MYDLSYRFILLYSTYLILIYYISIHYLSDFSLHSFNAAIINKRFPQSAQVVKMKLHGIHFLYREKQREVSRKYSSGGKCYSHATVRKIIVSVRKIYLMHPLIRCIALTKLGNLFRSDLFTDKTDSTIHPKYIHTYIFSGIIYQEFSTSNRIIIDFYEISVI